MWEIKGKHTVLGLFPLARSMETNRQQESSILNVNEYLELRTKEGSSEKAFRSY